MASPPILTNIGTVFHLIMLFPGVKDITELGKDYILEWKHSNK